MMRQRRRQGNGRRDSEGDETKRQTNPITCEMRSRGPSNPQARPAPPLDANTHARVRCPDAR